MDKVSKVWERITGFTMNIHPAFNLLNLIILSSLRFKRLKNAKWNKINLYMWAGLFITGIISVSGAYDLSLAFSSALIPFVFIWLYILGKYMIDNPKVFIKDMVRGTTILGLITFLARYFSWRFVYHGFVIIKGQGRADILGIGDNGLGVIIQAGIIGALGLLIVVKSKKEKLFYFIYLIINLSALIISSSRGAMVGTAAGSFLLTILMSWKVIAIITTLVGIALFTNNSFYKRALSIFSLDDRSNYMRIKVYEGTLNLIKDHFFFGVGPGNFETVYPQYRVPGEKIQAITPHNNYFNIISGWGIIGGLFFFGWIFYTIARNVCKAHDKYKKIIIAILIAFWVHVIFNDLATAYSAILMGLLDNQAFNIQNKS
ncbi:MAG TPA: O-antigen ligase family protein [Halanaerobiales bacterium]|nr:O-antigen ligase family protein [Halanaerobiales bacterium]